MTQIPEPAFTVNFETGESNLPSGFQMMNGAAVKDGAPGAVAKALRIDSDGPYVLFPNLDISPSKYPDLSMIIEFYLESIPEGSKGWLLNHDNGGYDRALVLHDERFNGISHGVGYPAGPVYDTYTVPEVGKWVQMVVTYRQGGECAVFVSNEKAPITHTGKNNDGKSALTLGRVTPYPNHWCDCWIKGVHVYDKGLSDEEVDAIFGKFKDEVVDPSGEGSDEESVDEGEESDESEEPEPMPEPEPPKPVPKPKPEPKPVINIKNGDLFRYGPWGGNCIASYANGVLIMNRIGSSSSGIKTWKCKSASDTNKLIYGHTVKVQWDNTSNYLSMTALNNNTIKVMHGSKAYYFYRTAPEPEPKIKINNGDYFNYSPWGGRCNAFYVNGVLGMNRVGSSSNGIKTWKCRNASDTKKLLKGQTVKVQWDNTSDYKSMTATNNNTLKVMHGSAAYYFKRA